MRAWLKPMLRGIALPLLLAQAVAWAGPDEGWQDAIARGIALRQEGEVQQSIDLLSGLRQSAESDALRQRAGAELGIALLQARRFDAAQALLQPAHAAAEGIERARYAVYLGNALRGKKRNEDARRYYQEALALADGDADLELSAGLNLARLLPPGERLARLSAWSRRLSELGDDARLARHHLNLGHQAGGLGEGALEFAYRHLDTALRLSRSRGDARLAAEALDALAQLYDEHQRPQESLALTRQALDETRALAPAAAADLVVELEGRQGRLLAAAGRPVPALAAYQRAVAQIEAVRQDIPIEYEDGRSSFHATLEPIYLGYADLLLRQLDAQPAELQAAQLRQVVDAVEQIRQTELQDFLGDRCAVEAAQGGASSGVPAGTAVLYPIILPDRLELLLQTVSGIERRTVPVDSAQLRKQAQALAESLRYGLNSYLAPARQLYDHLLKPFDPVLAQAGIRTLVVVPEGALRLVPMAALHDGERFAVEKYAVSMATGLSMTNTAPPPGGRVASLVAGVAEPGPVVEKLSQASAEQIVQPVAGTTRGLAKGRSLRALRSLPADSAGIRSARYLEDLRLSLTLPGVRAEVESLGQILPGSRLLDGDFTVDRFRQEAESGDYRIVHIASHGVFGGNAESSFILAYDDLLTVNGLQSLLKAEKFQTTPIEILSLSACETAEGNDRAPLGIAGAAIKARAKSVVGTLWPVEDQVARGLMQTLYGGVAGGGLSKAEALRRAQLELIRSPDSSHPFFWAPFVLIGNWL